MKPTELKASKEFDIRFSEVDSMGVVWHGSYPLYLEDAREEWGRKYGFGYLDMMNNGFYAPIVDMSIQYKRPIFYGMRARVDITYHPTVAAKLIYDYEIHDASDDSLLTTGHTLQVFMDKEYKLMLEYPPFVIEWKKRWNIE
ncbi:MAG: acyl-CoA thioesterase [Bacteroidaceae bacterium]|nr:acyl-CoA thioesterase [Bacteroidaceae bacterium]